MALARKKYVFRRRPVRMRIALAVIASGLAVAAISLTVADSKPGGYLRVEAAPQKERLR